MIVHRLMFRGFPRKFKLVSGSVPLDPYSLFSLAVAS